MAPPTLIDTKNFRLVKLYDLQIGDYEMDGDMWDEFLSDIGDYELDIIKGKMDEKFDNVKNFDEEFGDCEQQVRDDYIRDQIREAGYLVHEINRLECVIME